MDEILEETYGIMVYQEQVMQIFNQLGGIELSNAYKLIKAISKKNSELIAKFQPDFIKGRWRKGVAQEKAEEIFELILKFGGLRLQQVALHPLRHRRVSDRLHEDVSPRRVHGRPAHL